jgi:hypothetical protein
MNSPPGEFIVLGRLGPGQHPGPFTTQLPVAAGPRHSVHSHPPGGAHGGTVPALGAATAAGQAPRALVFAGTRPPGLPAVGLGSTA